MEHLSTLIVTGRLTEQLKLAEYADTIDRLWDRLADTIYLRRAVGGPYAGAAFEHRAMRAKRFLESGKMDRLCKCGPRCQARLNFPRSGNELLVQRVDPYEGRNGSAIVGSIASTILPRDLRFASSA
jgi:hypothetical protein